jgi:hypothetical protein
MEELRFHTLDELGALSIEELQALWDLVPTDRQKAYRAAYDREVRNAGALGSDAAELKVTDELLRRYADAALVPVGTRWARTPNRIQDAARQQDELLRRMMSHGAIWPVAAGDDRVWCGDCAVHRPDCAAGGGQ